MAEYNGEEAKNEYNLLDEEKNKILYDLLKIINSCHHHLEGNSFYKHGTTELFPELYTKQVNLFWAGRQSQKMCEIGFNAGHSAMLFLLGRTTPLQFTIFDINNYSYTRPCIDYVLSKFTNVKFEYIEGDSTATMPKWIETNKTEIGTYDLVHVDGGHTEECIKNDIRNADILLRDGGIMVVDDTDGPIVNRYVNDYINSTNYVEIDVLKTFGYPHRILRKVRSMQ